MSKKLAGIIFVIVLLAILGYVKLIYPSSQMQIKQALKDMSSAPIEQYLNSTDKKCGIWYESQNPSAKFKAGKDNSEVTVCFTDAFTKCLNRSILIVKDNFSASENNITYSVLRVIKANDQNDCIIQNNYEEYTFSKPLEGQVPLNFVNTCTVLNDKPEKSCEPAYVNDIRTQTLNNETQASGIKIETK